MCAVKFNIALHLNISEPKLEKQVFLVISMSILSGCMYIYACISHAYLVLSGYRREKLRFYDLELDDCGLP